MNHYEFAKWAAIILDFLCDYKLDIETYPVLPEKATPGVLLNNLPKTIPDNGENFAAIFEDFRTKILPALGNWNHPLNFSCYPSPNSLPTILGDMLGVGFGGVGFSWKSNPAMTELESLMIDWYGLLLGIPDCFIFSKSKGVGGGAYQQSNSDALYNIILAGRHKAIPTAVSTLGLTKEKVLSRLVLYASVDSHISVQRFCATESITYRPIKTDKDGAMILPDLENALKQDHQNQLVPFLVIATIGSFLKFGVDNVAKIRSIIKEYPTVWLHADGGYGGNAMLLKRYAYIKEGLEYADSFTANPHKWLQTGFDATTLWVRDTHQYQLVFVINPVYLTPQHPDDIDYRHYGIALSRRYRALKTWITFRMYGKRELELRIRKSVDLAEKFSVKLSKIENFEVVYAKFTFVNFVLKNASEAENKDLFNKLQQSKKILLMGVNFDGRFTLRLSPTYEYTKERHIDRAIGILKSFISKS